MPLSIGQPNVFPPGGYSYIQPETGMSFGGNEPFRAQVNAILSHRRGNHLARATHREVAEDLVAFTCGRVPGVCIDTTISAAQAEILARSPAPCGTCGGKKA